MSNPFRFERQQFSRSARRFLSATRRGQSLEAAAARAGVTSVEARGWMREPAFKDAYSLARQGKGGIQIVSLMDDEERLEVARARMDRLGITTDGFLTRGDR